MSQVLSPLDPIRVVVIDDSAYNRQTIVGMLESHPGIRVVGRAGDGEEGLKLVFQTDPHIVTLDLEMPKMDGFTFLRILMARRPTPVIVISGLGSKENVFKALELGALDFVVKPSRQISPELANIRDELVNKIRMVTQLRAVPFPEPRTSREIAPVQPTAPAQPPPPATTPISQEVDPAQPAQPAPGTRPAFRPVGPAPSKIVAIGASTGGPPAILQLLSALDGSFPAGIVITQHMPPRFTRAFAERLHRLTRLPVREAEENDCVVGGAVLIAPGFASLRTRREGTELRVTLETQSNSDYLPSIDRMFQSLADNGGGDVLGIVLTGMAGDGAKGVRAIKAAGGRIIAESPESAVITGMPNAAIATGLVDEVLPLRLIPEAIERFVGVRKPGT